MRSIGISIATLVLAALLATQVAAQGQVNCGNGSYCPPNNACLMDGQCAPLIEALPGSVRTAKGTWCGPGFREHAYMPGTCSPQSYSDCPSGLVCPPGTSCSGDGRQCVGGPAPTGPMCGGFQCAAGRVCSSKGSCMNPEYFHDCGNGTICINGHACEYPSGCAIVGSPRTPQIKRR